MILYLMILIALILIVFLVYIITKEIKKNKIEKEKENKRIEEKKERIEKKRRIERALANIIDEHNCCLLKINKTALKNGFSYINEIPSYKEISNNNNRIKLITMCEKNRLLIHSKNNIEQCFKSCKNFNSNNIEKKILLKKTDDLDLKLLTDKPHDGLLFDILKCKPIEKMNLLKKEIETLQYELITELIQYNHYYKNQLAVNEIIKTISLNLTNGNKEIILSKEIEFNGIKSANDIIFVNEKGIFFLEFIPYSFDNSCLIINNEGWTVKTSNGGDISLNIKFKRNSKINEAFVKKYINSNVPIYNISIICNKNMFIKNELNERIVVKHSVLEAFINNINTPNKLSPEEQSCIFSLLKEKFTNPYKEYFANKEQKIINSMKKLDYNIEYYNYIYKCLNEYKSVFELTQNMEIFYSHEIDNYFIRKIREQKEAN